MRLKIAYITAGFLLPAALMLAQSNDVVVRPHAIDVVLVNPGMGMETFQRFNGDALNAGLLISA
jgi:hypothetical protein